MAYFDQEKYEEAVAEFQEAARLAPEDDQVHLYLGRAYYELGRYEEAIAAYREAVRLAPDDAAAHFYLGLAYQQQGDLDQALASYQEAIRLDPNLDEAHTNIGGVYENLGEVDKAIAAYTTAIQVNPDNDAAHYNLGLIYHDQGLLEAAVTEYLAAIDANPGQADAYYNLGIAYYEQDRLDDAIAAWQESIRIQPDDSMVHNNLGRAYFDQGRLEEAEAELLEALRLDPANALAHFNLALVYMEQDRDQEAVTEFEAFLQYADPDDPTRPLVERFLASAASGEAEYRNEVGGYSLLYPAGLFVEDRGEWAIFSSSEEAVNAALAGDFESGLSTAPLVMFDVRPLSEVLAEWDVEATDPPSEFVRAMAQDMKADVLRVDEGTLGGFPAAVADVSGAMGEVDYRGFITFVLVEDRAVGVFAMARPEQWESFDPVAWEMTTSLTFFAPVP
jgi:tetratricopeptide (TPR) repeat protein